MKKVIIYTLSDSNGIKYIGKTKDIKKRYYRHIFDAKTKTKLSKRDAWIKSLLVKNERPIIEILDEVEVDNWKFWEKYWINQFRVWGFNLKNMTDGGEGQYGRITSLVTRIKMSNIKKGKIPKNYNIFRNSTIKGKILQYDLDGNLVKEWNHLEEAVRITGIKTIDKVIYNKNNTAGNYIWRRIGNELTNEDVLKIKLLHKKQEKKEIEQYDLEGKLIKIWPSYHSVKKNYSHIASVLSGRRKTAGGYRWKYKII